MGTVERMYIVLEGKLKTGEGDAKQEIGPGDYFGFEDIVRSQLNQDRIYVTSETAVLMTIDSHTLELLGTTFEELAGLAEMDCANSHRDDTTLSELRELRRRSSTVRN